MSWTGKLSAVLSCYRTQEHFSPFGDFFMVFILVNRMVLEYNEFKDNLQIMVIRSEINEKTKRSFSNFRFNDTIL